MIKIAIPLYYKWFIRWWADVIKNEILVFESWMTLLRFVVGSQISRAVYRWYSLNLSPCNFQKKNILGLEFCFSAQHITQKEHKVYISQTHKSSSNISNPTIIIYFTSNRFLATDRAVPATNSDLSSVLSCSSFFLVSSTATIECIDTFPIAIFLASSFCCISSSSFDRFNDSASTCQQCCHPLTRGLIN